MEEYTVIWTTRADNDLDEIGQYIAKQSPKAASKLAKNIKDAGNALLFMPHSMIINKKRGHRRLIVKKYYLIVFTVDERTKIVSILRVVDGRRDLRRVLQ
jgi:addiction module RelE/StbE family toxin